MIIEEHIKKLENAIYSQLIAEQETLTKHPLYNIIFQSSHEEKWAKMTVHLKTEPHALLALEYDMTGSLYDLKGKVYSSDLNDLLLHIFYKSATSTRILQLIEGMEREENFSLRVPYVEYYPTEQQECLTAYDAYELLAEEREVLSPAAIERINSRLRI